MGQSDGVPGLTSRNRLFSFLRGPRTFGPAIVVVVNVVAARARSEDGWMRDLASPALGGFERGLAALALAEQAPHHASAAVPQLLDALDGSIERLRGPARRSLSRLGPGAIRILVRCRFENRYERSETNEVLEAVLAKAGSDIVDALVSMLADPDAARIERVRARLVELREASIPRLADTLRSEEPLGVRLQAIELLELIDPGGARVLPDLRKGLSSPDEPVKSASAATIARIHIRRAAIAGPEDRAARLAEIASLGDGALPAIVEALAAPQGRKSGIARIALLSRARSWVAGSTRIGRDVDRRISAWALAVLETSSR
jgi:hypothetical protein